MRGAAVRRRGGSVGVARDADPEVVPEHGVGAVSSQVSDEDEEADVELPPLERRNPPDVALRDARRDLGRTRVI